MRRTVFLILVAFVAMTNLAACSCSPGVMAVQSAPAAAAQPCASCPVAAAGQPMVAQVVSAPTVAANGVQYVQVQYRVGAAEYGRAALAIPGNLVVCVGNFIRCATEALFPIPQPTATMVPAAMPAPAKVEVVQPPAGAPCQPAGSWQWVPAGKAVSEVELCPGGRCVPPDATPAGFVAVAR